MISIGIRLDESGLPINDLPDWIHRDKIVRAIKNNYRFIKIGNHYYELIYQKHFSKLLLVKVDKKDVLEIERD